MKKHSSALKRHRQSERRRIRNLMIRSRIKTETKKLLTFLQEGKVQEAKSFFPEYQAILMRSATKGYIPENRARRLLSRIQSRLHKLTSSG